jgi:hypothetical protein
MNPALILFAWIIMIYRPVPYAQVMAFLGWDTTDKNQYGQGYYCSDFANDMVRSAQFQGVEAHRVDILFTHALGHSIVAFETTDHGTIYVEPQSDRIYYHVAPGSLLCTLDQNICFGNGEPIRKVIKVFGGF